MPRALELRERSFKAMGSPCELRLYAETAREAETAFDAACVEIERLERKFSRYRDDSLTTLINQSAGNVVGVEVDAETASLLDYADIAYRQSDGLFDITSGILRRAWDFSSGRLPTHDAIDRLLACVGWSKVSWRAGRIVLPLEGMQVDFGGYVKEYTADRVAELCRASGLAHGLVNLGGDIAVVGAHPDGAPWRVGVQHPRREGAMAVVPLYSGGIATSGDYERFMVVDGVRYSHLLDPRTGWPVESMACVSVVADHCLVAGTATTVSMLKGGVEGPRWLDDLGLPNVRMDATGKLSGALWQREQPAQAAAFA